MNVCNKLECLSLAKISSLVLYSTLIVTYDYWATGQFGKVNFMSVITLNGINPSVVMLNVVPPWLLHLYFNASLHFYSCTVRHKNVQ